MERRTALAMVLLGGALAAVTAAAHLTLSHTLGHENLESIDLVTLPVAFFLLAEGGLGLWKAAKLQRLGKP